LWGGFGGFREILRKAEIGIKGTGGQFSLAIQLTSKDDLFVDQD
jgi:hypothetical protein